MSVDGFAGFESESGRYVSVPDAFFLRLLPQIRSPVELKVTLHLMWILSQRTGRPRCVEYAELARDAALLQSLKLEEGPRPAQDFLREGLELAVTRGSVLRASLSRGSTRQTWFLLNTAANRAAVSSLEAGQSEGLGLPGPEPLQDVEVYRPNAFALYEQNIGPLTAMIAEQLRAAEAAYPLEWIGEAVRLAVEYNRRNWRYIQAILQRWEAEGKDDGIHRRIAEEDEDPDRYAKSRYQHLYR
ncbi:MAG TPA: DnaD domain protein [Chloroflexota bacterium]|nr:DnaD domain protein [Chloroflexota bacterium]